MLPFLCAHATLTPEEKAKARADAKAYIAWLTSNPATANHMADVNRLTEGVDYEIAPESRPIKFREFL